MQQGGFRKKFSSQQPILAIFGKWKEILDNGGSCVVLLVDLSKVFDCMAYDLLLKKVRAYGFSYNSLKHINSFLSGKIPPVVLFSRLISWCSYSINFAFLWWIITSHNKKLTGNWWMSVERYLKIWKYHIQMCSCSNRSSTKSLVRYNRRWI